MASQAQNGPRWQRNSLFGGQDRTPSPGPPPGHARSKSTILGSTMSPTQSTGHASHQSLSDLGLSGTLGRSDSRRLRSGSVRNSTPAGTFAPKFIKAENLDGSAGDTVNGIEGENDFSGKRYVWLRDPEVAFVKGWVVEELPDGILKVQCDDGSVSMTSFEAIDGTGVLT